MCAARLPSSAGSVSPLPAMPSRCFTWLSAISSDEAVTKPDTTGWLRKLARNPRRSAPISTSIRPDRKASVSAACSRSAGSTRPRLPTAAAVISDMMATGPTDSAWLLPNSA